MNGAHAHLLLNHFPVIAAPIALAILALGLVRKNREFVKVGLGVVVAAALMTVPTFLTGEPAADVVGSIAGVTSQLIERHAEVAEQAFAVIGLAGLAALASLIVGARRGATPRWLMLTTVVLTLAACGWLAVTANFGGEIRHTEIRTASTPAQ
jgi:uncharacterized membrane protein